MEKEIKILVTGDFYAGNRTEELIIKEQYSKIFNDFIPLIQESDIAITNLESPITYSKTASSKIGPAMKALPKTIEALKFAGFNLLTLANNHIMDYGFQGLQDTIDICRKNNMDVCGAGKDLQSASQIFYKQVQETTVAIINIAENEFSTTSGEEPGANPLNPVANFYTIQEAKKNADIVFVIIHGGHEMYQLPSPRMKQTYRFFIDSGANAVIGHHTHCYSGYEQYNGGYIFYSLGNFLFDLFPSPNSLWNYGYAVRFIVYKNKVSYKIIPYEQSNNKPGVCILDKESEKNFYSRIEILNRIIADNKLLSNEFNLFCLKSSKSYNDFLEPYSKKFLYFLRKKGYIPSFLGKKKRLLYLNLIRCESHRDLIIKTLQT